MHSPMFHRIVLPTLLCSAFLSSISAVAQNELVPSPDAVKLRRVWTQEGRHLSADEYGKGVWGGVDLTGDSVADFAVYQGRDNNWLFYAGGDPVSTTPVFTRDSMMSVSPVVGDFLGDGRLSVGFMRARVDDPTGVPKVFYLPSLYWKNVVGFADTPWIAGEHRCFLDLQSQNLDGVGGDELIVLRGCSVKEVLIYKGGPGFRLDTPTVVISDVGPGGSNFPENWEVRFADFDGDGRVDMVMGGSYPAGGSMLRFYWGDENSPWSWATRPPDRDVHLIDGQTGIRDILRFGVFDLDDHPGADIVGYTGGSAPGTYVYLSGRGDVRTRGFGVGDADVRYANVAFSTTPVGYLNDSQRRYEMLPLGGTVQGDAIARLCVSGSSYGPDHDYEAWYAPGADGLPNEFLFQRGASVGDVTGDGYGDVLYSDWTYGLFVNTGIAFLLAGGPEIPFDDTTLSVAEYPVSGESGGLYLWPNPVVDELHIAWKGNLQRLPSRFAVYDLLGAEIVSGDVESYRGAALWRCASVTAGVYMVTLSDTAGEVIATVPIVRE